MNRAASCGLASGMLMRGSQKQTRRANDAFDRLKANVSAGIEGASIEGAGRSSTRRWPGGRSAAANPRFRHPNSRKGAARGAHGHRGQRG